MGTRSLNPASTTALGGVSLLKLDRTYTIVGLDVVSANCKRRCASTPRWLADAATAIAQGVNCAASLLDIEGEILDGSFARQLQAALIEETQTGLARYSWEGVSRPQLLAGGIGSDARVGWGAAAAVCELHAGSGVVLEGCRLAAVAELLSAINPSATFPALNWDGKGRAKAVLEA